MLGAVNDRRRARRGALDPRQPVTDNGLRPGTVLGPARELNDRHGISLSVERGDGWRAPPEQRAPPSGLAKGTGRMTWRRAYDTVFSRETRDLACGVLLVFGLICGMSWAADATANRLLVLAGAAAGALPATILWLVWARRVRLISIDDTSRGGLRARPRLASLLLTAPLVVFGSLVASNPFGIFAWCEEHIGGWFAPTAITALALPYIVIPAVSGIRQGVQAANGASRDEEQ